MFIKLEIKCWYKTESHKILEIVISQNISDAMVVVNSDDEEERKHLLSQDSSPLKVQNGDNIVKNQLLPRYFV